MYQQVYQSIEHHGDEADLSWIKMIDCKKVRARTCVCVRVHVIDQDDRLQERHTASVGRADSYAPRIHAQRIHAPRTTARAHSGGGEFSLDCGSS